MSQPPESLKCPECGCRRGRVLETREGKIKGFFLKMRIRLCENCGYHYRTKEVTDDSLSFSRQPLPSPVPSSTPSPSENLPTEELQLPPSTPIIPPEETIHQQPIKTVEEKPIKVDDGKPKKRGRPRKYSPSPKPVPQSGADFFPPVN